MLSDKEKMAIVGDIVLEYKSKYRDELGIFLDVPVKIRELRFNHRATCVWNKESKESVEITLYPLCSGFITSRLPKRFYTELYKSMLRHELYHVWQLYSGVTFESNESNYFKRSFEVKAILYQCKMFARDMIELCLKRNS